MLMTMPQIIMLNHAAWVNGKRMDARVKSRKDTDSPEVDDDSESVWEGKSLSEMTSDEMSRYYADLGAL